MMRIASAAPAADLLTGSAPPDDPAAASAFAAELDAATPGSVGDPAMSTSAAPAAPDAGTATVATTLAPATAAATLAHPIVLAAPVADPVETPNADAETAEQPLALDLATAAPQLAESAGEDALLDAPAADEAAADEAAADETTPVEVTPAPVVAATPGTTPVVAALAAADDAPRAPDTDAETEDAGAAPTPVAAPSTPAATATQAAPVAVSTATGGRPTTEPQPSAQPATASLPSTDAPTTPAAAGPLAPAETAPVVKDAAAAAPANVAPLAGPPTTAAPAPVAAAAPAAPVNAAPLLDQVRVPIAGLRELPDGAHLVTVHVTPDELGPVTVRALVHGGALDVQLTAPTDAAREALKALLPDLRRDLSQGGQPALLSLGDATADGAPARERDAARDALPGRGRDAAPETPDPRPAAPVRAGLATLDVLA